MPHDKVYGYCENFCKVEVPSKASFDEVVEDVSDIQEELSDVGKRANNLYNENLLFNLARISTAKRDSSNVPLGVYSSNHVTLDNNYINVNMGGGFSFDKTCLNLRYGRGIVNHQNNKKTLQIRVEINGGTKQVLTFHGDGTFAVGENVVNVYFDKEVDSTDGTTSTRKGSIGFLFSDEGFTSDNLKIYGFKLEYGEIATEFDDVTPSNEVLEMAETRAQKLFGDLIIVEEVYNQSLTLEGNASTPLQFTRKSGYKAIALGATYCGGTDNFRFNFDQNEDVAGSTDRVWVVNTSANSKTLNTKIQLVYLKNLS